MKCKTKISLQVESFKELSLEDMDKYLDEDLSGEDWDEDLITDDFDEIHRKVEYFSARIAELKTELSMLKRQMKFTVSDSFGGLSGKCEDIEYKIEVFEDQRDILLGHKDILEGKPFFSNEEVFAEARKRILTL
jgi:predicted nuclease with TOPRIM domain